MLHGAFEAVKSFLPRPRYANLAANLGGVETVAGPPATTSHVESTPEERVASGIPEALIRYSVGIKDAEDLIADLRQALDGLGNSLRAAKKAPNARAISLARLNLSLILPSIKLNTGGGMVACSYHGLAHSILASFASIDGGPHHHRFSRSHVVQQQAGCPNGFLDWPDERRCA